MPSAFSISTAGFAFTLRALNYENRKDGNGYDANWIESETTLELTKEGEFSVTKSVSLTAMELADFLEQLSRLDRELTGEATWGHFEGRFVLTIRLDAGRGTIEGYVGDPFFVKLEFCDVAIDQTAVRAAQQSLAAVVREFPVRGNPYT